MRGAFLLVCHLVCSAFVTAHAFSQASLLECPVKARALPSVLVVPVQFTWRVVAFHTYTFVFQASLWESSVKVRGASVLAFM